MGSSNQLDIRVIPYTHRYAAAYKIEIETVSELTIGGGSLERATSPFDIPVAKMYIDDKVIPYIPASTAKGLLRSLVEEEIKKCRQPTNNLYEVLKTAYNPNESRETLRELGEKALKKTLAQFIAEEILRDIEDKYAEGGIGKVESEYSNYKIKELLEAVKVTPYVCNPVIEGLACELPVRPYKQLYLKALGATRYPCVVCLTFGAPGYASNIHITNLYPKGELGKNYFILTRVHVAIDRLTGAAAEGKLFEMEYVTPGTKFIGYILVKGTPASLEESKCETIIEKWRQGDVDKIPSMLINMLVQKDLFTSLGRRKSTGMGEVKVKIEQVSKQEIASIKDEKMLTQIAEWVAGAL
ncbi:MAG: RAMP superfamily CRISPR-associated protein [Pyrobaculum sp.]